eukprot:11273056-Alexandrium_andersonii.AAC.1
MPTLRCRPTSGAKALHAHSLNGAHNTCPHYRSSRAPLALESGWMSRAARRLQRTNSLRA